MSLDTTRRSSLSGVSLVELMVGLTVGLLIVFAALAMYASTSRGAQTTLGSAKLNMEMRGAMDTMVDDIRRAGFGGDAFMSPGSSEVTLYDSGSCIVYSYDSNANGALDTGSPTEYFGFRIANNTVFVRNSGSGNCSTDTDWVALTDSNTVQIDAPPGGENYFTLEYQCVDGDTVGANERCVAGASVYDAANTAATAANKRIALLETLKVTMRLSGHLTSDSDMRMNLSETVLVSNHRVLAVP